MSLPLAVARLPTYAAFQSCASYACSRAQGKISYQRTKTELSTKAVSEHQPTWTSHSHLEAFLTLYSPKSRFLSSNFLCRSTCKGETEFSGKKAICTSPQGNQPLANQNQQAVTVYSKERVGHDRNTRPLCVFNKMSRLNKYSLALVFSKLSQGPCWVL